jgi:hypothetical protein
MKTKRNENKIMKYEKKENKRLLVIKTKKQQQKKIKDNKDQTTHPPIFKGINKPRREKFRSHRNLKQEENQKVQTYEK